MDGLEVLSSAIPLPSPPPAPASASADGAIVSASTAASSSNAAGYSSSVGEASSTASRLPGYQPVRIQTEGANVKRSTKACLYCRKGKAKCDGLSNSWPCRRCRENAVECVFEGISMEELRRREEQKREDEDRKLGRVPSEGVSAPVVTSTTLEARLARLEAELDLLRLTSRSHDSRLGHLEEPQEKARASPSEDEGSDSSRLRAKLPKIIKRNSGSFERFAREAFDLFWEMYAPLAPYIVPTSDGYEQVKDRSPGLMHCIVAVASRHSKEAKLVEYNRKQALRLMRETLHSERPVTLDDLKASLVWNAWLGKGTPPGHTITLALQLDLPRALENLVAAASNPDTSAEAFEELMPACRIWLTLYAQDLWLSLSLARRPLVTIDLSITSARLLLALPALRPVDARLIAQSELVTILGVLGEHFLKIQHQSVEHTVQVVQQTNSSIEQWISTWCAWTTTQENEAGRYILASFSIMLQSARFFANTRGLQGITSSQDLLPIHLPFLRTALDAATRIQGIHTSQKLAHSSEMTQISLSSAALFLLKMIKLIPSAFSPIDSPAYSAFAPPASEPDAAATASSPDTAASSQQVSFPSVKQAISAARHASALLSRAPTIQQKHAQAIEAALKKLETEMGPLGWSSVTGAAREEAEGGSVKRRFEDVGAREGPRRLPPPPMPSGAVGFPVWPAMIEVQPMALPQEDLTTPEGFWAVDSSEVLAASFDPSAGAVDPLDDLAISSLIGSDSFWSWSTSLPEGMQSVVS